MSSFTLMADQGWGGDLLEHNYYTTVIVPYFPQYELFWRAYVVPLTNRPQNINFRTDSDLQATGKIDEDVTIAQLHYSVLWHLTRAYDVWRTQELNSHQLAEAIMRLVGAQDVAFELLQRWSYKGKYSPWDEGAGSTARKHWQKSEGYPLQSVRDYRNHVAHGRVMPGITIPNPFSPNPSPWGFDGDVSFAPRIGNETRFIDWRKVVNHPDMVSLLGVEFAPIREVISDAWKQTTDYLQIQWNTVLLKSNDDSGK